MSIPGTRHAVVDPKGDFALLVPVGDDLHENVLSMDHWDFITFPALTTTTINNPCGGEATNST